jgi:eukaryotic-like serine/threonine-protein kinase
VGSLRAETQTTELGRYRIVKRLAAGGMADVLLARTDGIEGFERHVVVKRIHPDLLEEERYIKMFLDEARLAASLHHHNIVQVNDIGEQDGAYFFAMEYVHGEDVRSLLVDASDRGKTIPLEHVITIVTGAAAGLHHAHEQRGADRAPLHIVHRDVSPANILVGFDGSVKVADFGIALAAHRSEHTQSGVLKGKVAYMSPEQCNCERLDRRSDVFSLGIVLYELATVHPCFHGDNDFMTMTSIVAGTFVPPSHLNATVTPELEAIIVKALARDPAARYQTADELRLALEHYATSAGLRSSTTALADYMTQQFGTRALPWLDDTARDDDEEELAISIEISGAGEARSTIETSSVIVDDALAIPVTGTPRPVKPTLPLRTLKTPQPMPRIASPAALAPTPSAAAAAAAAAAADDDVELEIVSELAPIIRPANKALVRGRGRLWIGAGVLAALAAIGTALVLMRAPQQPTTPAITAPADEAAVDIEPVRAPVAAMERVEPVHAPPTIDHASPASPASVPAPMPAVAPGPPREPPAAASVPVKKSPERKPVTKPAPSKKWDPNALFPR